MGGQLGSSSSSCLVLYSSPAKIPFPKICGFWGVRAGAKMRGAPPLQTRFERNRHVCIEMVSADMRRFPGLKKVLRQKLPNKILKVHVKKIAKTKGQLKPAKFLTTKNCLSSWSKVTDAKLLSRT